MALVERVVAGGLEARPQLVSHAGRHAAGAETLHEGLLEGGHQILVLLADGLAQIVRLSRAETAHPAGDGHVLLLVDGHAVGGLQNGPQGLVGVDDRGRILLVARVGRDVLHGARSVEGDDGDEVLEARGGDVAQRFAHTGTLELKPRWSRRAPA